MSNQPNAAAARFASLAWRKFELLSKQLTTLTEDSPALFKNERFRAAFDRFYSAYQEISGDDILADYMAKLSIATKALGNLVLIANKLSVRGGLNNDRKKNVATRNDVQDADCARLYGPCRGSHRERSAESILPAPTE